MRWKHFSQVLHICWTDVAGVKVKFSNLYNHLDAVVTSVVVVAVDIVVVTVDIVVVLLRKCC